MFKKDFERTPQEKARRAQFSILARLGGCGYLVYIIVQVLMDPKSIPSTAALVFAYILLAAAVIVVGITIYDLIHGLKHGRFSAATYDDEETPAAIPEETTDAPESDAQEADASHGGQNSDSAPDEDDPDASDDNK